MKIATFNCNSIRSRLEIIKNELKKGEIDVLALQETKVQDHQFPVAEIEEVGFNPVFSGQKQYNGVAVLTRDPVNEVSFGLQDNDDGMSNPRLILCKLKDTYILNTYVPQGADLNSDKFEFKIQWLERLMKFLEARFNPGLDRLIWVGDLNIAPEAIDVHDHKKIWPHVCHCQQMTDIYTRFTEWGFVDIFRKHIPEEKNFTFWDYRVRDALNRNIGWRIDHILATPPVAEESVSCSVDTEPRCMDKPSDHTFVMAEFSTDL